MNSVFNSDAIDFSGASIHHISDSKINGWLDSACEYVATTGHLGGFTAIAVLAGVMTEGERETAMGEWCDETESLVPSVTVADLRAHLGDVAASLRTRIATFVSDPHHSETEQ